MIMNEANQWYCEKYLKLHNREDIIVKLENILKKKAGKIVAIDTFGIDQYMFACADEIYDECKEMGYQQLFDLIFGIDQERDEEKIILESEYIPSTYYFVVDTCIEVLEHLNYNLYHLDNDSDVEDMISMYPSTAFEYLDREERERFNVEEEPFESQID